MTKNNLRSIRQEQGLSQLQLSMRSQVAQGVVSSIENGKLYAYPGWRTKLASALGVSEERLFPEVASHREPCNSHG